MARKPVKQPGRPAKKAPRKYAGGGAVDRLDPEREQAAKVAGVNVDPTRARAARVAKVPVDQAGAAYRPLTPPAKTGPLSPAEKARVDRIVKGFKDGGPVRRFKTGGPTDTEDKFQRAADKLAERERAFNAAPKTFDLGSAGAQSAPYRDPARSAVGRVERSAGRDVAADTRVLTVRPGTERASEIVASSPPSRSSAMIGQNLERGREDVRKEVAAATTPPKSSALFNAAQARKEQAADVGNAYGGSGPSPMLRAAVQSVPGVLNAPNRIVRGIASIPEMVADTPMVKQNRAVQAKIDAEKQARLGPDNPFVGSGRQRPAGQNVSVTPGRASAVPPANSALMSAADVARITPDVARPRGALRESDWAGSGPHTAADGWRKVDPQVAMDDIANRPASPGQANQQGATSANGTALPVPSASRVNTVPEGTIGAMASAGRGAVGSQGYADNALLRKWYSLPENERGRAPASVRNAMHRGESDQATAMNVARAQVMEAGLPPEQQAIALGRLEAIQAQIARQEAEAGHWQRGDAEAATASARRDQILGGYYDAQGRHLERSDAMTQAAQPSEIDARRAAAEAARSGAMTNAARQRAEQQTSEAERAGKAFAPRPVFDPDMMKAMNPYGTPEGGKAYEQMVLDQQAEYDQGRLDLAKLESQFPGMDRATLLRAVAAKSPETYRRIQAVLARGYAAGGAVQAPTYGGTPTVPRVDPLVQAFRDYTVKAQAAGVPTVPFAQFVQLKSGGMQGPPQPGAMAMAKGGPVPVGGKMVVDTNPNAGTDSIPAVIDGKAPAALDSGEFVFTKDATAYYGTKFLNSMMEKARAGAQNNAAAAR